MPQDVVFFERAGAEANKEKEKEDHARLPAQVPASRVLRNPGGNDRQERMDAAQQDRQFRRAAAF